MTSPDGAGAQCRSADFARPLYLGHALLDHLVGAASGGGTREAELLSRSASDQLSRGACLLHARTAEFSAFFTVQALGIRLF
jgi:hypothetical protein